MRYFNVFCGIKKAAVPLTCLAIEISIPIGTMATVLPRFASRRSPVQDVSSIGTESSSLSSSEPVEKKAEVSAREVPPEVPPLGEPRNEKRFWFQRSSALDKDAVATQLSVFDDRITAQEYQPRADW